MNIKKIQNKVKIQHLHQDYQNLIDSRCKKCKNKKRISISHKILKNNYLIEFQKANSRNLGKLRVNHQLIWKYKRKIQMQV